MERSALGRRLSSRFVAGIKIEDAVRAAHLVNAEGLAVSIDSLGESVTSEDEARAAAAIYQQLLDTIAREGLNANVSLKLTQMGIEFAPALAEELLEGLVAQASELGSFVRIDMESSALTETTIALTERLNARYPASIGTVLQAYLKRSESDAERLLRHRIRVRLCKGAYLESPSIAFAAKSDVDANYINLARRMVSSGVFCGIATHDPDIIEQIVCYVTEQNIPSSAFEFQMLYGIRRDLQRRLVHSGFGVRVYIPFGQAWYPYFMRRLAERPANVLFLLRNLFRS